MRDTGRFKERYDFSLDSRQLGLVLFAALVAAAVVFVLGMSVGRQWEQRLSAEGAELEAPLVISTHAPEEVLPPAPPVEHPAHEGIASEKDSSPTAALPEPAKEEPEQETMKPEDLTFPKVLAGKTRPAEPVPKPVRKTQTPAAKGAFTVQVGAFRDKAAADELSSRLKKKGYEPGVHVSGGMYRVHVGSYSSRNDAQKAADRLASSEKLKPYVTTY